MIILIIFIKEFKVKMMFTNRSLWRRCPSRRRNLTNTSQWGCAGEMIVIIVNIFVIFIIIVIIVIVVMIIFCSGKAKGSVCWVTVVFSSPSSSLSSSSCCSCTGWSVISSSFQNKHSFCIVLNIYVTFAGLARNISHNVSKFTFCIPTLILQNTFPPPFQHLENLNLIQGF